MNTLSLCKLTVPAPAKSPSHREVFDLLATLLPALKLKLESMRSYKVEQGKFEIMVLVSSADYKHPFRLAPADLNVEVESIAF